MNSKAFIVFLIVSGLVSFGLILFFAKRHPNPRFRPKKGEVLLVSIFMTFLSVGFSFFMSQLFEHDWNLQKANKNAADSLSRPSGGGGGETQPGSEGDEDTEEADDDTLPPFLKEEE